MAIGWMMLLQNVPWADVIKNAPKVAEGAKKLWKTIGNKTTPDEADTPIPHAAISTDAEAIARLQKQLAKADAATAELHAQMLASSELIAALAEQNTLLIRRVELNRLRVLWLTGAVLVVAGVAMASLVLALKLT
jgi:hypothetical protein